MIYDGTAAESAHVSINDRATASIIDEKKLLGEAASEAAVCQIFQLSEAEAGHGRTQWHVSCAAFRLVAKLGPVVGNHPPPATQVH
jgi:hypothetical protein